jgi:hypothetical protein
MLSSGSGSYCAELCQTDLLVLLAHLEQDSKASNMVRIINVGENKFTGIKILASGRPRRKYDDIITTLLRETAGRIV